MVVHYSIAMFIADTEFSPSSNNPWYSEDSSSLDDKLTDLQNSGNIRDSEIAIWGQQFNGAFPDLFARMAKDLYMKPLLKILYSYYEFELVDYDTPTNYEVSVVKLRCVLL